jgi:hypothetical protein
MPLSPCFRLAAPLVLFAYAVVIAPLASPARAHAQVVTPVAPTEAPRAEGAPSPPPPPDEAAQAAPELSPLAAHQQATLRKSLADVQHERESTSTLLPWLLTGLGAAVILVGLVAGAESSFGCDGQCKGASPVPAWLVVGGTTAGIAGMIWLVRTRHEIGHLDSREYRIKSELERIEWNSAPIQRAAMSPSLTLRASF